MHFRRFAQQYIQWHINRIVVEMAVMQRQMRCFGCFTNHSILSSFTTAQLFKQRQLVSSHSQNITFL